MKTILLIALLLTGCHTTKELRAEYNRGWSDGFDEASQIDEMSEHIVAMKKWMRGEGPKPQ